MSFEETEVEETPKHTLLAELVTDLHACCVEALDERLFLCGLYELDEGEKIRRGRLVVCDAGAVLQSSSSQQHGEKDDNDSTTRIPTIPTRASVDVDGGVLDCKIAGDLVAAALSCGQLDLYRASNNGNVLTLCGRAAAPEEGLFLSVDWSCGTQHSHHSRSSSTSSKMTMNSHFEVEQEHTQEQQGVYGSRIAVSTQESSILVYDTYSLLRAYSTGAGAQIDSMFNISTSTIADVDSDANSRISLKPLVHIKQAHKLMGSPVPVWIVSFDPHSHGTRLLSGGDDCAIRLWDVRCNSTRSGAVSEAGAGAEDEDEDEDETPKIASAANTKTHTMGVTSAQWHPQQEHIFVTGSYDGYARLWDARQLRQPIWEKDTGGGIWRSKWWMQPPSQYTPQRSLLGFACMHAGSAIYSSGQSGDGVFEEPVCLGTHYPDGDARDGHLAYGFAILSDPSPSPPASADHEEEEKEKDGDNSKFAHSFLAASSSFYDNRVQLWSI